jgi:hypothetical protein
MVIPETSVFTVSTHGDGYSRNESIYCEHTWWWLFQKRVYLLWAYLVMVIPETSLFTVSTPGDGYSRNESIYCEHTWWWLLQKRVYLLWAHLVMVIPETRRNIILDI